MKPKSPHPAGSGARPDGEASRPARLATVLTVFLAALAAAMTGAITVGASTPVVAALGVGVLGLATAGGAVLLGRATPGEQP